MNFSDATGTANENPGSKDAVLTGEDLNQRLIWVYLDASKMSEDKLSGILTSLVWPALDSDLTLDSARGRYFTKIVYIFLWVQF